MDRYTIGPPIGEGNFGQVFLAVKKSTGEQRAIKMLRGTFADWRHVLHLREIAFWRQEAAVAEKEKTEPGDEQHVVRLYEMIRTTSGTVHLVMEYLPDRSLQEWLLKRSEQQLGPVSPETGRDYTRQILQALTYMHEQLGYMHRDIKPENILLHGSIVKVADFSLARPIPRWKGRNTQGTPPHPPSPHPPSPHPPSPHPPSPHHDDPDYQENSSLTTYVSTRWYRAPEIIWSDAQYGSAVDVFATACVAAEMATLWPLFPGQCEWDLWQRMWSLLGPTDPDRAWISSRLQDMGLDPTYLDVLCPPPPAGSSFSPTGAFSQHLRDHGCPVWNDPVLINFLWNILRLDPATRPSARQALQHDYFVASSTGGAGPVETCFGDNDPIRAQPPMTNATGLSTMESSVAHPCPRKLLTTSHFSATKTEMGSSTHLASTSKGSVRSTSRHWSPPETGHSTLHGWNSPPVANSAPWLGTWPSE